MLIAPFFQKVDFIGRKRLQIKTKSILVAENAHWVKIMKKSENHQFSNLNKSAGSADFHEIFLPKGIYMIFGRRSKSMDILVMIPLIYWNFRCQIAKKSQFQKSKKSSKIENFQKKSKHFHLLEVLGNSFPWFKNDENEISRF
mgnify:CR=1 FL=1